MAEFGRYNVWLLDWTGEKIAGLFPGNDFISMSWQHKLNAPGPFRCELVAETTTKDKFRKHYQILIERNYGTSASTWKEEYVGFHLGTQEWWTSGDVDEHYWASMGFSPEWLLDQPLIQPVKRLEDIWTTDVYCTQDGKQVPCPTPNEKYYVGTRVFYDKWWNYGPADDSIKLMADESMGGSAELIRQYSNFTVEGYRGEGSTQEAAGEWVRLLDAITDTVGEDGSKGGCDFRVQKVSGGYQMRTYAPFYGTDRRRGNSLGNKPTVFSFENGNIRNPDKQVIWANEVTVAYGGWQGGGSERSIVTVFNTPAYEETPYNKREAFYDFRDATTLDSVGNAIEQKLIDDGQKEIVIAEILQTDACLYGRDWEFGDLVTLDFPDGSTYDMRITEVNGSINGQSEEQIEGVIERWTRGDVVT